MRQKTPIEKLFNEIENSQLKELYDTFMPAANSMYQMKKGFVDAGFTEDQAMELIAAYFIESLNIAKEGN